MHLQTSSQAAVRADETRPNMAIARDIAMAAYSSPMPGKESIFRLAAAREIAIAQGRSRRFGIRQRADWQRLAPSVVGEPAFLLGGGPSVLQLTRAHFSFMEHGVSMSHEWWIGRHDFVPNVIWAETTTTATWQTLSDFAHNGRLHHILVTRVLPVGNNKSIAALPAALQPKTFSYTALSGLGLSPSTHQTFLERAILYAQTRKGVAAPDYSTLERMLFALAIAGHKRAVLCGYDLEGRYFYAEGCEGPRKNPDGKFAISRSLCERDRILLLLETLAHQFGFEAQLWFPQGRLAPYLSTYRPPADWGLPEEG